MAQIIGGIFGFAIIFIIVTVKVRKAKEDIDNYNPEEDNGI